MNSGFNSKIPRGAVQRRRTQSQFIKRVKICSDGKEGLESKVPSGGLMEKKRFEGIRDKKGLAVLREDDHTNSSTPFCDEKESAGDKDVNMEVIVAKEAFYDLRLEARNYLKTTERLVKSSQIFCDENRKMFSYSLVESIKQPAQELNSQPNVINSNANLIESPNSRDSSFQDEIERLKKNYEKLKNLQEIKLESESVSQSCTSCEIF